MNTRFKKKELTRKVLWLFVILNYSLFFIQPWHFQSDVYQIMLPLLFLASMIVFLFLVITSKKYYNWSFGLILLFLFNGFIMGKLQHVSEFLLFFYSSLILLFALVLHSVKSFILIKKNRFVSTMVIFSGFIIAVYVFVLVAKYAYWNLGLSNDILTHIINLLLMMITLVLVIKLPSIDFSSWLPIERSVFFKQTLLPISLILLLSILVNLFPDQFGNFFTNQVYHPGFIEMHDFELFDLIGIK